MIINDICWKKRKEMGIIKTSLSALNMYNICLFVNYTLISWKKEKWKKKHVSG